ncbi:MAG: GatB/YqeY domain-containing protein [Patescibacteria group bacterium]
MSLHEQIKGEIKQAMLAKDKVRLSVVRGMVSAFMNELVATGKTPQDTLSDDEVLKVIKRLSNQRKDSIEQFEKGGRPELAESEREELAILEKYLPTLMSREDIKKVAVEKKQSLGVTDKAKAGQLTGAIMKELAGKADGADVKAVVDELFA